jgi:hypothetical protein
MQRWRYCSRMIVCGALCLSLQTAFARDRDVVIYGGTDGYVSVDAIQFLEQTP